MMEWPKPQPDPSAGSEMGDTSVFTLLETIKADHVEVDHRHLGLFNNFTLSQLSGSIGTASTWDKPSLSLMHPCTDKPPLVLSRDHKYGSAVFVTISGRDYLAAASKDHIHLWNLAENTSCVVYKFKEQNVWLMCLIDERTVACVVVGTSSDGFSHIYILKTDTEMWTLSSTHLVKVDHSASDIAYVKTSDGTPCLVLSYSSSTSLVQSVELVGGKIRWHVDQQQMSEKFYPRSICTDGNTVFITDPGQYLLHLLSVDDGSVITSINLRPFGFSLSSCVRLHGEHLLVGHVNKKGDTYCISTFIKPTEI